MNIESIIDWIKSHRIKTIFIIIGLFIIPLLVVHLLFKWNSGCAFLSAEWSAGDLIGYISGFEVFAVTIFLGIIAVWQAEKANKINDNLLNQTKENERNSVLPFLSFNTYIPKYVGNSFVSVLAKTMPDSEIEEAESKLLPLEDNAKRVDILLSELIYTISADQIKISSVLSEDQKEKINCQIGIKKQKDSTTVITDPDYSYKKIYIENSGKGSAINTKCRLFKIGNEANEKFDVYSIPFTLPVEKHFDLGLYLDFSTLLIGNYILEFTYQDIYANIYSQEIPITLGEEFSFIDFFQPQKWVNKNNNSINNNK